MRQSFCEAAAVAEDGVSGRWQILARMIRYKLAVVQHTAGCLVPGTDKRRSFAVLPSLRHILAMALDMTTVAAAKDKIQKVEGKAEAGSDAVHGWAEGWEVVAHSLEDNGIVEDMEEVAAAEEG